jgi:hypothetical protein
VPQRAFWPLAAQSFCAGGATDISGQKRYGSTANLVFFAPDRSSLVHNVRRGIEPV